MKSPTEADQFYEKVEKVGKKKGVLRIITNFSKHRQVSRRRGKRHRPSEPN